MIIKTTWYDHIAEREIRKAYWYWTNWANKENKKSNKKRR